MIISMPDSATQLQRLYLAGFEFRTFELFPKCVGVTREGCLAMLIPGSDGMQIMGRPGWQIGDSLGVLVERNRRQVFQFKDQEVEATPERLESLKRFETDLQALLRAE